MSYQINNVKSPLIVKKLPMPRTMLPLVYSPGNSISANKLIFVLRPFIANPNKSTANNWTHHQKHTLSSTASQTTSKPHKRLVRQYGCNKWRTRQHESPTERCNKYLQLMVENKIISGITQNFSSANSPLSLSTPCGGSLKSSLHNRPICNPSSVRLRKRKLNWATISEPHSLVQVVEDDDGLGGHCKSHSSWLWEEATGHGISPPRPLFLNAQAALALRN